MICQSKINTAADERRFTLMKSKMLIGVYLRSSAAGNCF